MYPTYTYSVHTRYQGISVTTSCTHNCNYNVATTLINAQCIMYQATLQRTQELYLQIYMGGTIEGEEGVRRRGLRGGRERERERRERGEHGGRRGKEAEGRKRERERRERKEEQGGRGGGGREGKKGWTGDSEHFQTEVNNYSLAS